MAQRKNNVTQLHDSKVSLPRDLLAGYFAEEEDCLRALAHEANLKDTLNDKVKTTALELIDAARGTHLNSASVECFLKEYSLDTVEGVSLMCLAEALIRIPDQETAQTFISAQLGKADWKKHLGHSSSFWVNASTWGLLLSGKLFQSPPIEHASNLESIFQRLGAPIAQSAIKQAMSLIGNQFVSGTDIKEAIQNGEGERLIGYSHSYDMLGEAALTEADAQTFFDSYESAITEIGNQPPATKENCAISIKLSALHPRYESLQEKARDELSARLKKLVLHAKEKQVPVCIDAEESFRLEISLKIFAKLFNDQKLADWPYLGLAVQAYQKRAPMVIDWLLNLSQNAGKKIPVRLVKGAYWDSEIKWAQQEGLPDYPVFTQKSHTDICYLCCAEKLLGSPDNFYPQFATHNAHTIASVLAYSEALNNSHFEFQRLHGMGDAIYDYLLKTKNQTRVRIYSPVGAHKQLLPYLVRRLLENGANSSFVHYLNDDSLPNEALIQNPFSTAALKEDSNDASPEQLEKQLELPNPLDIYREERRNSRGLAVGSELDLQHTWDLMKGFRDYGYESVGIVQERKLTINNPADTKETLGAVRTETESELEATLTEAELFFSTWKTVPAHQRAEYLLRCADLLEENRYELQALLIREAGKTLKNAVAEVREAVDFCRYYAIQCKNLCGSPAIMDGPTGESNELYNQGRGVFLCISPWNFPLAIFMGQVAAALAAGNCVLAKPATATPLIARKAVEFLHQAGIPQQALHFIPCSGSLTSSFLCRDNRVAGVAFTGSTEAAQQINRNLAARSGPIVPFIAETGGQNAMIVDSTALPEQVVNDAIESAFDSAGQRCSALRVIYLQEEIADKITEMLVGRMKLLKVGNPFSLETDIGPVINHDTQKELQTHIKHFEKKHRLLAQATIPETIQQQGHFVAPTLFEIPHIQVLKGEVFGPVLHLIRYGSTELDDVIEQIHSTEYGLTLGIHSRIEARAKDIAQQVKVGNVYINRNMVGATVGVQPFGGQACSGTGPKAGGPHYLQRFMTEKHVSINTAALGGNTQLLTR